MAVPYTFASATTTIPLANLDANFTYFTNGLSVASGVVTIPSAVLTTADINGGTIDNVIIGATTAAAATITTLTATAGTLNNISIGASTPSTAAFTTLSYTSTLTGGTGVINIGSGQIYKNASGFVGIGTTTPNDELEVNGRIAAKSATDVNLAVVLNNTASGGKEYQFISSATGGTVGANAFAIRDNTAGANRASLGTSGNWFFGTTTTSVASDQSRVWIDGNNQSNWGQRTLTLQNTVSGDSNPAIGFHAAGNSAAGVLKFYGVGDRFEFRNAADTAYATVYGASFVNASDYRLKKDVKPSDIGLSAIMALNPVKFKWIDDKQNTEVIGFIADEAQEVLPQAVIGAKDGVNPVSGAPDFQGMKDTVITAVLVKAIQELKAELDAYKKLKG
jgi:hypothetical protein